MSARASFTLCGLSARRRARHAAASWAVALGLRAALSPAADGAAEQAAAGAEPRASFARALQPRAWSFPRDHGAHPAYATEWWYFTGILRDQQQRRVFGYELTFFRTALRAELPAGASPWRARDLILAHLAVTDVEGNRFAMAEEVQRAAAGLAGADSTALHVWAGTWSARATPEGFRLRAVSEDLAVELELTPQKGVVLHGEGGLSRKTNDGRHASQYYSMPRLGTVGTVRSDGATHVLTGTSWMDHEFFTGDTPREGLGWDWFSARLQDGRDLMLYVVRTPGTNPGTTGDARSVHAQGTLVQPDGNSRPLDTTGMTATSMQTWTSPGTGITYPVRWRVELPREAMRLEVVALVLQQEIQARRSVGFSYWEGACRFEGTVSGMSVAGEGYVELTGYERLPAGQVPPGVPAR